MNVSEIDMPIFALKNEQFWDLPLEISQKALSLGV